MIIYLYRWKLKPGREHEFINAWSIVTEQLIEKCSSLGSRLHIGSDGLFYGYAQWPDKETRENALSKRNHSLEDASRQMKEATAENLPEIALEPRLDCFRIESSQRAPTISTQRLTLRAHGVQDFADCDAMWSHPDVTRYIGGKPSSPQQVWSRILNYTGHWTLMRFGYWAVEEKSTGQFAGEIGFADFKRDISPSIAGVPELGFAFAPQFHGKGYASEAIQSVLLWGEKHLEAEHTVCIVNPENSKSVHLSEKFGYRRLADTMYNGQATRLFRRAQRTFG